MINKVINFFSGNLQLMILLLFVLVPLVIVGWLILLNWKSSENYELFKPVIGGLLVACFLILTTFFSPIEPIKYKTDIVVLTKNDVILGFPILSKGFPEPLNGYDKISTLIFELNQNKIKPTPKENHQYVLELIEYASMRWIGDNYPMHWQLDRSWIRGLSGGGGQILVKPGAETYPEEVELRELLKDNMYSASPSVSEPRFIFLPHGTKITYKNHIITLDNNNIQIQIVFGKAQFMEKLGADLGGDLEKDYGPNLYAHYFTVEWTINTKRPRRWSPRTKEQIEWAKEIGESYAKAFSFLALEQTLMEKYRIKGAE